MEVPMPQQHRTSGASASKGKRTAESAERGAEAQAGAPDLPTTEKGLREHMARHQAAYLAYQDRRAEGVPRAENPHGEGYTEWKRAYKALLAMGKGLRGKKGAQPTRKAS